MFRIDDTTAAPSLPTPEAAGTEGFFTGGNPAGGVPATRIRASWLNRVQELLRGVVLAAGIAPGKTDYDALRNAIRRLAGASASTRSATGTLTADEAGLVSVSAAGGNVTLTLPAANAAGGAPLEFLFVRTDTSANTVTVQRAGSNLIEGLASFTIPVGGRIALRGDGVSNWRFDAQGATRGRQVFTSGGTFTVPPGVFLVRARVWGGGGGGGGGSASLNGFAGTGGGGGGYSERLCVVAPGQAVTVTVGAGGTAGPAAGAGGGGGTSSFGAFCSATGGFGGGHQSPGGTVQSAPGEGSGGDINIRGQAGMLGLPNSSTA